MPVSRLANLDTGNSKVSLPAFFPSVSSVKTSMPPADYIALLRAMVSIAPQFLVSAFDLMRATADAKTNMAENLEEALRNNAVVLMDSGNYESYWTRARRDWQQRHFHEALRGMHCQLAFTFDAQEPPSNFEEHVDLVVRGHREDQGVSNRTVLIPIVHGTPEALPQLCAAVVQRTAAIAVAVPERRLGSGVFQRARTVAEIRKALDAMGQYTPLHLLGTGNPISIALYAVVGADCFDGLEWCQTVVDFDSAQLFHLSHADFFQRQTQWGDSDLPFPLRTLAHNLEFFTDWMARLRSAIAGGAGEKFCELNFPPRIYVRCRDSLGWSGAQ
jgi:queuine/archaeosine tRNA-ribosyltransferase